MNESPNVKNVISTRKEQIFDYLKERNIPFVSLEANSIMEGIEWADEHPDSKRTYTKQQLIDIGFAFTTNGDIVTPDQLNEDLKKYLKYQKQKFIEKARKWLQENLSEGLDPDNYPMVRCYDIDMEDFIKEFIREMEE